MDRAVRSTLQVAALLERAAFFRSEEREHATFLQKVAGVGARYISAKSSGSGSALHFSGAVDSSGNESGIKHWQ